MDDHARHLLPRPSWFDRLWRGAVDVSPLEEFLVRRFVSEMPPDFRPPLETQLRAANLIQRDPDWTELRFYTTIGRRVDRSQLPSLPVRPGEVKLLSVSFDVGDEEARHANFWAVDRQFVMVHFDRSIEACKLARRAEVIRVRQSWRSNVEPPG